jgi:hypothetical protein
MHTDNNKKRRKKEEKIVVAFFCLQYELRGGALGTVGDENK